MTVVAFVHDDKFIYRVTKYHKNNPDNKWVNTYEFVANIDGSLTDLLTLGTALVQFEQAMHYNVVTFDRLLISTWEPDSVPYNPLNLVATPLTAIGTADPEGSDVEPLNMCLNVRRFAGAGRFGHLFYRGALIEGQVESPAGKPILTNRTLIQTSIDNALSDSGLDAYIGVGGGDLSLSMINLGGDEVRTVLSLQAAGVASVPMDHAWFNRTTA